jgi:predicted transposase/invertase (TIGR01784 family)
MNSHNRYLDLLPNETPNLELIAKVININFGKCPEILERDKTLEDYSYFIYLVGNYKKQGLNLEDAIIRAIKDCLNQDKLREYLEKHGSEVVNMLLTEWNMEDALRVRAEEGREEGREEGALKSKIDMAQRLAQMGISLDQIAEAAKVNVAMIKQWLDGNMAVL